MDELQRFSAPVSPPTYVHGNEISGIRPYHSVLETKSSSELEMHAPAAAVVFACWENSVTQVHREHRMIDSVNPNA